MHRTSHNSIAQSTTPLTWEELDAGTFIPASLSPEVKLERVSRMGDLFAPVLQADQRIDDL
jgi:DNA primase